MSYERNILWLKDNSEKFKASTRVEALNTIRNTLGCRLQQAFDFWEREPTTWVPRLIAKLEYMDEHKVPYYESPEEKIRSVLRVHYVEVSTCGDVQAAQADTLKKICMILGYQPTQSVTHAKL